MAPGPPGPPTVVEVDHDFRPRNFNSSYRNEISEYNNYARTGTHIVLELIMPEHQS